MRIVSLVFLLLIKGQEKPRIIHKHEISFEFRIIHQEIWFGQTIIDVGNDIIHKGPSIGPVSFLWIPVVFEQAFESIHIGLLLIDTSLINCGFFHFFLILDTVGLEKIQFQKGRVVFFVNGDRLVLLGEGFFPERFYINIKIIIFRHSKIY